MKTSFLAITLMALLLFGGRRDVRAQIYAGYPYISYEDIQYQYYLQWQQYLNYLQQNGSLLSAPYGSLSVVSGTLPAVSSIPALLRYCGCPYYSFPYYSWVNSRTPPAPLSMVIKSDSIQKNGAGAGKLLPSGCDTGHG
jgi:hypothetical protein